MILGILPILIGLVIFEIISSFDNAVINASIAKTLPPKLRRFFHTWGIFVAVFLVRAVLPFLIVWAANPNINFFRLINGIFIDEIDVTIALEISRAFLLLGGGLYLFLVFSSWLFREKKNHAFLVENFIERHDSWFYIVVICLSGVLFFLSFKTNPWLTLPVIASLSLYFIVDGLKRSAEREERLHRKKNKSGLGRLIYLEIIDASFSVDGILGAFAFTLNIPLIIIGSSIGALIVRYLTVKGSDYILRYAYIKNGAMYSIGLLGLVMIFESFGNYFPFWITPTIALMLMMVFLSLSIKRRHFKRILKMEI